MEQGRGGQHEQMAQGGSSEQQQVVEEASPISSRPPATSTVNMEELMRLSAEEGGGVGSSGGGGAGGNRWPREETLALLKIRSDMDAAFREATVKGPLWEDVSRKLAELGYSRSAKKCKEKFENVHKYYKRTKEGRGARQDGKAYKFFSQLEALNTTTAASTISSSGHPSSLDVAPVSVGIPPSTSITMHFSPFRPSQPFPSTAALGMPSSSSFPTLSAPPQAPPPLPTSSYALDFSSNSSSTFSTSDTDEREHERAGEPLSAATTSSRKRKRQSSKSGESGSRRMMELFRKLMKQVMQKQEAMQQRFLEAMDKREQERLAREEAWKRQEMARLAREHELMAKDRAASASRDTAIISLIQKITGHTIHLPTPLAVPPPLDPQPSAPPSAQTPSFPPTSSPTQHQQPGPQISEALRHQSSNVSSHETPIMAIPEQQLPPQQHQYQQEAGTSVSSEPASSRWPKAEVFALIDLRSGLDSKYQEAGPKGPLWEEIAAGMQRMGYSRSAKRCKEKWENINKYYKKVKESNKKRPEDAKTCPYFHQLDALYRDKMLVGSGSFAVHSRPQEQPSAQHLPETVKVDPVPADNPPGGTDIPPAEGQAQGSGSENKNGDRPRESSPSSIFGQGNGGAGQKPEDIVKELMQRQGAVQPHRKTQVRQQTTLGDFVNMDPNSFSVDHEEQEDDEYEDEDEELEEEESGGKMGLKIEFQQRNTNSSKGGGNDDFHLPFHQIATVCS